MLQEVHHLQNHLWRPGPYRGAVHAQLCGPLHGREHDRHQSLGEDEDFGLVPERVEGETVGYIEYILRGSMGSICGGKSVSRRDFGLYNRLRIAWCM